MFYPGSWGEGMLSVVVSAEVATDQVALHVPVE
jgi:hypothetical protein